MSLVTTSLEDDTPGQKLAHAYGVIRQQELGENVTMAGVPSVVVDAINRTKNLANRIRVWEAYLESQVSTDMPRQVFHPGLRNALEISHRAMIVLDELLVAEDTTKNLKEIATLFKNRYELQLRLVLQAQETLSEGTMADIDTKLIRIQRAIPLEALSDLLIYEGEEERLGRILGKEIDLSLLESSASSPFISADKVRPITIEDLVARTAA